MSLTSQSISQPGRPTLGFLTPGLNLDSRYYDVWVGSDNAAREQQVNLVCFSVGRVSSELSVQENPHKVLLDFISSERLDGLITFEWWPNTERFEQVCGRYRPLPLVNVMGSVEGCHSVTLDYDGLMRVKLRHLIEDHGYRRIAYLRGAEKSWLAQTQYQFYRNILTEYGLPLDPALIVTRDELFHKREIHVEYGRQAVQTLLDERQLRPGQDFEVILSYVDDVARGVLNALKERGIRVPGDVAVLGSGGMEEAGFTSPPLTTTAPPYYELGRKAVEVMLALLAGESIPQQTILPVKLHVRRSCGCLNPSIIRVAADPIRDEHESLESQVEAQREQILSAMTQVTVGSWDRLHGWAERLLDDFMTEMTALSSDATEAGTFIPTLEDVLYQVERAGGDVNLGHDVLSALSTRLVLHVSRDETRGRHADNLWHQGRILIHTISREAQRRRQIKTDRQARVLREIGQQLISTFEMAGLMRILAEGLPRLGISGCYLSLYEHPAAPEDGARLMLAYSETNAQSPEGRIEIPPEGLPFQGSRLIPDDILPTERALSLIIESLHFGEKQIGFVVFETQPQDEKTIYEILRGEEISSALQGALLLGELIREKYILDTFMETIPDLIYFKDRDSVWTHANPACLTRHGLSSLKEGIGKTDFDFFPKSEARVKFEQEQEIIRSGKPILALEEIDAQADCFLTTKMPLRDESGKIVGTFGISRDITELKLIQQSLKHANAEIRTLNERLEGENLRMGAELDVARRLQEMVLPNAEELRHLTGLELVGYMQPADEVGGDYYDILEEHGTIHIGIGDVAGHGLESGVIMMMTQAAVRALLEHGETDRIAIVNTLNRMIYKNVRRMGTDKPLTFALLTYQDGHMSIVGQHENVLLVRKSGRIEVIETVTLGFPVGLVEDISEWVAEANVFLGSGDGIVLYTDGITEAENAAKAHYGLERLCAVIHHNWSRSVEDVKQAVIDDVYHYIGEQTIYDDLTLVILKQQ